MLTVATVDNPVIESTGGNSILSNVAVAGSEQALEVSIFDGSIAGIKEVAGPAEWVCLPPLVDKHVHANRAFTLAGVKPASFEDAIALAMDLLERFSAEQYCSHARQLFQRACSHGTTGIRTHADMDSHTRFNAVQGTLDAKASMAGKMDIEVVGFASSRLDPAGAEGKSMIREALARGADLIGAAPALYPEPKRSIDAVIELAIELDAAVDLHQDEHLLPELASTEYLADAVSANGCQERVTLSHGCVLSALEPQARNRVIEKLAQARIEVVALPTTNLYLQDRRQGTPQRRGLTCVHELLDAGVAVRFASDNVCDAFYPYGDADLLDTACGAMLAAQLDSTAHLVAAVCDGKVELAVNDSADLVLVRGRSFDDILSRRPAERIIIRAGEPLEV
ncbi:MAG: amidohydrolase family protein [Proteobacteria bacterium]|nr:amidohydrolase family protein [Pseudomonadota bacterium]